MNFETQMFQRVYEFFHATRPRLIDDALFGFQNKPRHGLLFQRLFLFHGLLLSFGDYFGLLFAGAPGKLEHRA